MALANQLFMQGSLDFNRYINLSMSDMRVRLLQTECILSYNIFHYIIILRANYKKMKFILNNI